MRSDPNAGVGTQIWPARATGRALLLVALRAVPAAAETPSEHKPANVLEATLGDNDRAPEISTAELRSALSRGDVTVLDARPYAEYAVSHIPGALAVAGKPGMKPSQYTADAADVARVASDRTTALIVYCNGLYCGRSKRFAADLASAGYTNVKRYQLGIPAWRALGGVTQVEKDALESLLARDGTAVLVDAREPAPAQARLRHAVVIPVAETTAAKDDGRLPMTDHNTRIFVVGANAEQARAVAEAIVKDAFHNVSFFGGSIAELRNLLAPAPRPSHVLTPR